MLRKYDLLTLLIPSIFSFVNIYICISFIMVSVSPFNDKKTFSLCMDRPSKKPSTWLWLISPCWTFNHTGCEYLFRFQPFWLCIVCWTTQTILVHWHSQLIYLYPCAVIFFTQGSRPHTFAQKTPINPLMLVV